MLSKQPQAENKTLDPCSGNDLRVMKMEMWPECVCSLTHIHMCVHAGSPCHRYSLSQWEALLL